MRSHIIQTNFNNGVVSPDYRGNTQAEDYYKSIQVGENVVVTPTGGIKRRGGLEFFYPDWALGSKVERIEPFFESEQNKLIVLMNKGTTYYEITIAYPDLSDIYVLTSIPINIDINTFDISQASGAMIFTHETLPPFVLINETPPPPPPPLNPGPGFPIWVFKEIVLLNIPSYNFDTREVEPYSDTPTVGFEPVWSLEKGYPKTNTFFQGRLWFGGSTSLPMTVWGSQLNSFFDFDISVGDTNALFDNLEYQQINPITAIYGGRSLQVFTSGNEFINTSAFITQSDSAWVSQTNYGSKSFIKPVSIDGSVLFVDRSGVNVRQHVYKDSEGGFVAYHTNRKSAHLSNDIKAITVVKGTSNDVSDYLILVNGDGTASVMNSSRLNGIQAWTQWTTEGLFKDVMTLDDDVYFIVERFGVTAIEKLNYNLHTDMATLDEKSPPVSFEVTHFRDDVINGLDNVIHTAGATASITEVSTFYDDIILSNNNSNNERERFLDLIIDRNIYARPLITSISANKNKVILPTSGYHVEIGINYPVKVLTMPLNAQTQSGQGINLRKRVIRVILHLLNSNAVIIEDKSTLKRQFPLTLDTSIPLFTGIKEVYLLGYGRLVEIEISQELPYPMTILSIDAEVEA